MGRRCESPSAAARSAPRRPRRWPAARLRRAAWAAGAVGAAAACGSAPAPDTGPRVSPVPLTRAPVADSEPDDDVTLISDKGHVEPAVVEAALAPRRDELTRCYTQKVGRRSWLGGKVVLHWEVSADGSMTTVRIAESDLGAWPIESCVLAIVREISFGAPVGGPAELTLPLELSTARTVARAEEPLDARSEAALFARLDGCARGEIAMPEDVALTIYLGRGGRPMSVGFASPAGQLDDEWSACAEKAVLGWRAAETNRTLTKHLVRYRAP